MLTNETYKVTLKELKGEEQDNQNSFKRNSDCMSGGNEITVKIINHPDELITGVKITLFPYIPGQDLGNEQIFDSIVKEETFEEEQQIFDSIVTEETFEGEPLETKITVNPALSYRISVSYSTKYGYLNPSENVTSQGELEIMMLTHLGKISFNLH